MTPGAEQWFFQPAALIRPCVWETAVTDSRMRAFARATAVPKMNTSGVLDVARFIVGMQDGPVTSELRVFCQTTCLCVTGTTSGSSLQWPVWKHSYSLTIL